ncbi:enoyl-CoA hydratase-related protein [Streptomyces sp. NPDC056938]|uniref:enoyl-CoA hydratase-related protein n=1 Tax=unclassified Streptomyces TaxID=2593676 RepID=UPI00364231FC
MTKAPRSSFDRPGARNAVKRVMTVGVAEVLDAFNRRDRWVIGVITGAGRTFCSGMDLKVFLAGGARSSRPRPGRAH